MLRKQFDFIILNFVHLKENSNTQLQTSKSQRNWFVNTIVMSIVINRYIQALLA